MYMNVNWRKFRNYFKQLVYDSMSDTPPKRTPVRVAKKVGRNEPCHCGSGRKYKKCCLSKEGR